MLRPPRINRPVPDHTIKPRHRLIRKRALVRKLAKRILHDGFGIAAVLPGEERERCRVSIEPFGQLRSGHVDIEHDTR